MRQGYYVLAFLSLCAVPFIPVQSHAAGTVDATSSATFSIDPGFENLWKYTINLSWDLNKASVGHLDVFLDVEVFDDTCNASSVVFDTPAGHSTGINTWGQLCEVEYLGEFLCKTDPSLQIDSLGYSVKFEPIEVNCQTDLVGTGTLIFYTAAPPGIFGEHEEAIAIKHGPFVDFGTVVGRLPGVDGLQEVLAVKINEFLVKPKAGDSEFVEVFNASQDTVDVEGWQIFINDTTVIGLEKPIPPGGVSSESTFVPSNTVIINFDEDPAGNPIAFGTSVTNTYVSEGVLFSFSGEHFICDGVFANGNHPGGFGSLPNVVSTCPDSLKSDISENFIGLVTASFLDHSATQVCIDVHTVVSATHHQAIMYVYDEFFGLIATVVSAPDSTGQLCWAGTGAYIVQFSGLGNLFARFDDLVVTFDPNSPPPDIIGKTAHLFPTYDRSQLIAQQAQQEMEDFVPDEGGTIVLVDENGVVQDSVAYGNAGGAPISAPLVIKEGTSPPPGFVLPTSELEFGTLEVAAEDETVSTSTQRVIDGQDSGNDAQDFNTGPPSPNELNTGNPQPPDLGSSLRLNTIFAHDVGTDVIELFNPLGGTVDISGWHISDGSIITPIFTSGQRVVESGGTANLLQGFPEQFDFELEFEDVLYLYDENLVRLDQLGWSTTPFFFPDSCLLRDPDGAGPADCFDFDSCGGLDGRLIYDLCELQGPDGIVAVPEGHVFKTKLAAPYPNPARGASNIYFTVGGSGEGLVPANVTIFDVAGRKVRDLIRGEFKPGIYGAQWNGVRNDGSRVKAGVYFVRMRVNHQVYGTSRSIVWLK